VCNASAEDLPILPREVEVVLRTLNAASAARGDGLSYGFWKALDPRGEILAGLFEICRTSRRIPDQWRTSRVILIYKNPDGDLGEVSNWRPISVCRTLYNIYTAVLARRLQAWAQRHFTRTEGIHANRGDLVLMYADGRCLLVSNSFFSFGSVSDSPTGLVSNLTTKNAALCPECWMEGA